MSDHVPPQGKPGVTLRGRLFPRPTAKDQNQNNINNTINVRFQLLLPCESNASARVTPCADVVVMCVVHTVRSRERAHWLCEQKYFVVHNRPTDVLQS